MIGANLKTPSISLEEVFELAKGSPYDIDFFRDYSHEYVNGQAVIDCPLPALLDDIVVPQDECAEYAPRDSYVVDYYPSIFDEIDEEKERKRKKKKKKKKQAKKLKKEEEKTATCTSKHKYKPSGFLKLENKNLEELW